MDPQYAVFMANSFAEQLRLIRQAANLTQAALAKKLKCSATFISNMERGDRTPPPETLENWADDLGLHGRIRERFMNLAMITHLPKKFHPRFLAILRRLEKIEGMLPPPPDA